IAIGAEPVGAGRAGVDPLVATIGRAPPAGASVGPLRRDPEPTGTAPCPARACRDAAGRSATSGIAGTVRATTPAPAPLVAPPVALGAGGPAKIWPSTPTWPKPPPRASTIRAASIADGTISATLEAP